MNTFSLAANILKTSFFIQTPSRPISDKSPPVSTVNASIIIMIGLGKLKCNSSLKTGSMHKMDTQMNGRIFLKANTCTIKVEATVQCDLMVIFNSKGSNQKTNTKHENKS